jgi:ABC-type molybdate transport system substrate-binding protein
LHSPLAHERYRIISAAWYTPLRQQMILIKGASIEARQLFEFMLGNAARAILVEHGFIVPNLGATGS